MTKSESIFTKTSPDQGAQFDIGKLGSHKQKGGLRRLKLASFKADQRPYCSSAANHTGAAVLAHVARSGRLDAAHS